jgi:predicted PurR-regulated permease PerM
MFITIAYIFTSQRLFHVRYEVKRSIVAFFLTFLFTVLVQFIPEMGMFRAIAVKILFFLVYLVLLVLLGIIGRREWGNISDALRVIRSGHMRKLT